MKGKTKSVDMTEGPLLGKIITYTIPIILTGVLQLLFNSADLIVVGRFCGSVSVAAVGATLAVIYVVVNLFIGLGTGAGVNVAHAIGAREDTEVKRYVETAFPTAIISGVALTIFGLLCSRWMMTIMGTPDNVIDLSVTYMKIYFCGMTSMMVYNFCSAILRAAGDTRSPLIYLIIAGIINVVLNVFFVTVFDMNVAGVALATSISQTVSAVLVVINLARRTDACRLVFKDIHIYKNNLLRMIQIGLPAGIQGSLFSISNALFQSSVNSFGSVVMSGDAASRNLEAFLFTATNSFNQAAMNFAGQNFGAGKMDRVKKTYFLSLSCSFVLALVMGLAFRAFSHTLLGIYITDSEESIAYGAQRIMYMCTPYFIYGLMDVTTGALRGLKSSTTPMLISILGICGLRIAWLYTVFPAYHTLPMLYIAVPLSWVVTFVAEAIAFAIVYSKRKKELNTAAQLVEDD